MTRSYCRQPGSCVAGRRGRCSLCHQQDDAARARMSAASKAALADPEVRARMSAARKAAWADPEVRARMSAASKAALADPEVRARMSAARKSDPLDQQVALAVPFKDRARSMAIDLGIPADIAEDAIVLMEDDGMDAEQAIAMAFAYAGCSAPAIGRGAA